MPRAEAEVQGVVSEADTIFLSISVRTRIDVLSDQTLIYDTFRGQTHLLGGPLPEPLRSALMAPVGAQISLPQEHGAWLDQLASLGLITVLPSAPH